MMLEYWDNMIICLIIMVCDKMQVGDMLQEVGSSADFNCGGSSRPDAEFRTDGRHELEKTVIQTNVRSYARGLQSF